MNDSKDSKKYYKDLDLIRFIACIAVLLYHLNILKGGYLAVCIFFVLSGYLAFNSSFNKEHFTIFAYYKTRIKKIYLPLLLVVFITIFSINFIPNHFWLNLKPETTSILLGYNNFWQISANLDYFARHTNSPFIHFWYIGILLQFDLIFPFVYLLLKKIKDKTNKLVPLIITILLSIGFTIYFYITSLNPNIMISYYHTLSRIFSILFGLLIGLIYSYYGFITHKKVNLLSNRIVFYLYILILLLLFIFIDATSKFFAISMIFVSLITCRLIIHGTFIKEEKSSLLTKIINSISKISYEIYLVQYPIIYIFQDIKMTNTLKIPIIIILVFILSFILHFIFDLKKKEFKVLRIIYLIVFSMISLLGFYEYIIAKDYTKEMKILEQQLAENQKLAEEKQKEYEKAFKENQENWLATLEDLENDEKELTKVVANLAVVGVGDSIMLGAVNNLYKQFPNGYFDAKISRTAWVANGILQNLKNKKKLGDPIILNLGANGDCPDDIKIKILKTAGNRKVFWVNVTNDKSVNVNNDLKRLSNKYSNLHIVDWNTISKGHTEYFVADRIHLTNIGKKAYTKAIYDKIYQVYLEEYLEKKQEIINKHEEESKKKISFYGNQLLLNAFNYLKTDFPDTKFVINDKFNYTLLKEELETSIKNNNLTNKIVLAFDDEAKLNKNEYQNLINICSQYEIYLLVTTEKTYNEIMKIKNDNIKIINFYQEIKEHHNYLMVDRIHLSNEGNIALSALLQNILKPTNP